MRRARRRRTGRRQWRPVSGSARPRLRGASDHRSVPADGAVWVQSAGLDKIQPRQITPQPLPAPPAQQDGNSPSTAATAATPSMATAADHPIPQSPPLIGHRPHQAKTPWSGQCRSCRPREHVLRVHVGAADGAVGVAGVEFDDLVRADVPGCGEPVESGPDARPGPCGRLWRRWNIVETPHPRSEPPGSGMCQAATSRWAFAWSERQRVRGRTARIVRAQSSYRQRDGGCGTVPGPGDESAQQAGVTGAVRRPS